MKRVMVIGCPGAGKTEFAKKLRDKTCLPLFHLDLLYWMPDGSHLDRPAFFQRQKAVVDSEEWIIDGNYSTTLELRLSRCDTVFFLDYPVEVCMTGVMERRGKKRDDLPWVEPPELDDEFAGFIRDFPENGRPKLVLLLEKYEDKEIHIFHSRAEGDAFLEELQMAGIDPAPVSIFP